MARRSPERIKEVQDTAIKLAQCPRCSGYVWVCDVSGGRVAVDPLPLGDQAHVMVMLGLGRSVYQVALTVKGKPDKLQWLGGPGTVWEPNGRLLVAAHGCGAPARSAVPVEVPSERPSVPVCDVWRAQGWSPPATCPRVGVDGRTGLLFGDVKAPLSCGTCDAPPFDQGEPCGPAKTAAQTSPHATPRRSTAPPSAATGPPPGAGSGSARRREFSRRSTSRRIVTAPIRPITCNRCGKLIKRKTEQHVAIECGQYAWGAHDYDCKKEVDYVEAHHDKVKQLGWDTTIDLARKNLVTRNMDTVELPDDA